MNLPGVVKSALTPGSIPCFVLCLLLWLFLKYAWPRRRRLAWAWLAATMPCTASICASASVKYESGGVRAGSTKIEKNWASTPPARIFDRSRCAPGIPLTKLAPWYTIRCVVSAWVSTSKGWLSPESPPRPADGAVRIMDPGRGGGGTLQARAARAREEAREDARRDGMAR